MRKYKYRPKYVREKLKQKKTCLVMARRRIVFLYAGKELSTLEEAWLESLQNNKYTIQLTTVETC